MQLLILIFLLSHVATVTAVVSCISDRDKDHRPRKNCTAAGFGDIPAGIEPSTKVLLFPNNLFSSLSWSSYKVFEKIYEIDLTGNKIPEVPSSVSPILDTLRVLRMGTNRLTSLSDNSFAACPGLAELYLENNVLNSLSDNTFSGLSKLEILDLSSNHITVLPAHMLLPLPAIETLILENNKIKVMPDDWFSQKEDVPYLYLSANPWVCSCSLGYLRRYLEDYELNVYVRDGPIIKSDGESVVCDSPQLHKGKPVLTIEESDLCSPATAPGPTGIYIPTTASTRHKTTAVAATIPPPPPPPPPPTTTTTTPTIAPTPTVVATPAFKELHTEYYKVVTWSRLHSYTRLIEWSEYSGSVVRSKRPQVEPRTSTAHPSISTVIPSTESPVEKTTTVTSMPTETTKYVPSVAPKIQVVSLTTTVPSWVIDEPGSVRRSKISDVRGAGVFCFWLFAACLLLCIASAVCILVILLSLITWYRKLYKPLSVVLARSRRVGETVRLLTYSGNEEKEVSGGEGVKALYRSVLFIEREREDAVETEDGGKEGEVTGRKERFLIPLEPTGGREATEEQGGIEERGVYKKTVYRMVSKEEEIDGWRDVMEECRVSPEDRERRGERKDEGMDGGRSRGGVSRKRYSVILREEREEAEGGREGLEWVVGGWEVKREGERQEWEEPRSSWGELLSHYLPSMPWGVAAPPEGEAEQ